MTTELVWALIRQDEGGNRYRVGRYATRAEAERVAKTLVAGERQVYVVERISPTAAPA
ncbi:Sporulation related domain-containing protein [Actinacidiphila rubida]|uniref:Sporulation related domain-containing protein n=1 Tax=Actinacidiphila rubida TaxID=310780 RepID=A0A1H8HEB4_9ACTN|nr:SPOR domain-containing protein [Actinacidiphila rubida]SEN54349.1 Sporulation related domain-containing protein [Actinacidiphila rubida]